MPMIMAEERQQSGERRVASDPNRVSRHDGTSQVLDAYPKYVTVGALPLDSDAQKLDVAQALVEAKLVLVKVAST